MACKQNKCPGFFHAHAWPVFLSPSPCPRFFWKDLRLFFPKIVLSTKAVYSTLAAVRVLRLSLLMCMGEKMNFVSLCQRPGREMGLCCKATIMSRSFWGRAEAFPVSRVKQRLERTSRASQNSPDFLAVKAGCCCLFCFSLLLLYFNWFSSFFLLLMKFWSCICKRLWQSCNRKYMYMTVIVIVPSYKN